MKKIRGYEPIGVIIHIYMEISQGNSLCCYFYLKQAKMSFFFLFFFYQIREQNGGTGPAQGGGVGTSGRTEVVGKGVCVGVNIVQMLCTHACKCKNDTC
jgi:hypothetical protein